MSVTKQEVAKIAGLARINMSEEELERMVPELNNILDWVEQLGEVAVVEADDHLGLGSLELPIHEARGHPIVARQVERDGVVERPRFG